jgi:casein kinase II subunit alpha
LSLYEIRYFLCHLLVALDDLHRLGIMHRDVKPRNVLVNRNLGNLERSSSSGYRPLTLIDLGLAEFYQPEQEYNVRVASRHYKAPELLLNFTRYTPAVDLWGVGCMLAGLLLRREPLFRGRDNADQLVKIVAVLGTRDLCIYLDKFGIDPPAWLLVGGGGGAVGDEPTEANAEAGRAGSVEGARLPSQRIADWTSLRRDHHHHRRTETSGGRGGDGADGYQIPAPPPQDSIDLLNKLLVYDHSRRYTARQALDHPFFDPVRARVLEEIQRQRQADHRLWRWRRRKREPHPGLSPGGDRAALFSSPPPPASVPPSDLAFLSAPSSTRHESPPSHLKADKEGCGTREPTIT